MVDGEKPGQTFMNETIHKRFTGQNFGRNIIDDWNANRDKNDILNRTNNFGLDDKFDIPFPE